MVFKQQAMTSQGKFDPKVITLKKRGKTWIQGVRQNAFLFGGLLSREPQTVPHNLPLGSGWASPISQE
jgi:hypothetical protein